MSASRTYTVGQVLTASQVNDLPQGTIGYAQVQANQTGITTEVDLTTLTVTVTLVAGRRIRIVGSILVQSTVAGDAMEMNIKEGTTILQVGVEIEGLANQYVSIEKSVVIQPSAGTHTYKLSLQRLIGTGTLTMIAAANATAFILVEDIGI